MDLNALLALNVSPTQIPLTQKLHKEMPDAAALLKVAQNKGGWFSFTEEEVSKYTASAGFWLGKFISEGFVTKRLIGKQGRVEKFSYTLDFIRLMLDANKV
jgi:hypothetical protein